MVSENDKPYICLYCVAFIDILGIKAEMKPFLCNDYILSAEGRDKFKEVFGDQLEFIKFFRQNFQEYFKSLNNEKFILQLSVFSDSVVIFVPLGEDIYSSSNHSLVIEGISYLIKTCGFMFMQSLFLKRVLRAGIDLGWGTELENNEIFGPALIKAYELERTNAKKPRIIIGKSLIDYLETQKSGNRTTVQQTENDIKKCKVLSKECLRLIDTDYDSHHIIDYLNKDFINFYHKAEQKNQLSCDDFLKSCASFVSSELKIKKDDPELRSKYSYLMDYLNKKLKHI